MGGYHGRRDLGRSQWNSVKGGSKPDRIADSGSAVGVIPMTDKGRTRDGGYRTDSHYIPRQTKQGMGHIWHQKPLEGGQEGKGRWRKGGASGRGNAVPMAFKKGLRRGNRKGQVEDEAVLFKEARAGKGRKSYWLDITNK